MDTPGAEVLVESMDTPGAEVFFDRTLAPILVDFLVQSCDRLDIRNAGVLPHSDIFPPES